jgi:hypothetical protein
MPIPNDNLNAVCTARSMCPICHDKKNVLDVRFMHSVNFRDSEDGNEFSSNNECVRWTDVHYQTRIIIFFCGEGPRSKSYGRTAALRRIVQPCDEDVQCFFIFPSNGAPVE